jgi:hypothetical protein
MDSDTDDDILGLGIDDELATIAFIVNALGSAVYFWAQSYYLKIPYHTSALSGDEWVDELMTGHPERIRCELGVHLHVFKRLLSVLRKMGYGDSKHITLREQLAIFLYTCVTGLTIRHVGERFQHSNDTISK